MSFWTSIDQPLSACSVEKLGVCSDACLDEHSSEIGFCQQRFNDYFCGFFVVDDASPGIVAAVIECRIIAAHGVSSTVSKTQWRIRSLR
jgi:hypothetical protein